MNGFEKHQLSILINKSEEIKQYHNPDKIEDFDFNKISDEERETVRIPSYEYLI